MCNAEGSAGITCGEVNGLCTCNANIVGEKCTNCNEEHFGFPNCTGIRSIDFESVWFLGKIISKHTAAIDYNIVKMALVVRSFVF